MAKYKTNDDSDYEIVAELIERYHDDPNALNYILGYRSGYIDACVAFKLSGELQSVTQENTNLKLENSNLKHENDKLEVEIKKLKEQFEYQMRHNN